MTFSVPINVTNFTIQSTNITLVGVECSNVARNYSTIFWAGVNSNNDSASYCFSFSPTETSGQNLAAFCANVTAGIPNFFSQFGIIFAILAVAIVVGILFIVAKVVSPEGGGSVETDMDGIFEKFNTKVVFIIVLNIALVAFLIIVTFGALCNL